MVSRQSGPSVDGSRVRRDSAPPCDDLPPGAFDPHRVLGQAIGVSWLNDFPVCQASSHSSRSDGVAHDG